MRKYVIDGDVGCGAPGSPEWHKAYLAQLSHDERVEYVKEVWDSLEDKLSLTLFLMELYEFNGDTGC